MFTILIGRVKKKLKRQGQREGGSVTEKKRRRGGGGVDWSHWRRRCRGGKTLNNEEAGKGGT